MSGDMDMRTLARLQSGFQQFLLDESDEVVSAVTGADDEFRRARLNIYYNAYRLRLAAALASDYPALKAWAGDDHFWKIANAYIQARPSVFRNLRWFGHALPAFLGEDPRFNTEPLQAELAEFEWAQGLAFDAADAPQLAIESLATVPPQDWERLHFVAHPSLILVRAHTNIVAIWNAYKAEEAFPAIIRSDIESVIAVWRRDHQTWFRTLVAEETMFWKMLAGGSSFGDACGLFAHTSGQEETAAAQQAASLLAGWLQEGWIESFELRGTG